MIAFLSQLNARTLSFHAAALLLGVSALASKLLGLVRDRLLAARFGAGETLDIYYASFQIPDLLFTLFLIGAASAAVLPTLMAEERKGRETADRFLSNLLTVFSVAAAGATIAAAILAPDLVAVIAPGFGEAALETTVGLTRLMLANALLLAVAGVLSSALQVHHRFAVYALVPIVYNVGIIVGITVLVPAFGVSGLAYGVLLGGALQVIIQIPALRALGVRLRPRFHLRDAALVRVVMTAAPRVAALAMSQITLAALVAIASLLASGSISVFRFAANLLYVPVGLFGVPWALALFPKLSDASLGGAGEQFRAQVALGVRNILFWVLPASALAIVLRAHIVRVVLGSGAFDWEDTRLVAALLAVLAFAVISESVLPLLLRAFYALGRTLEPLAWDVASSLITIALALGTAALFRASPDTLAFMAAVLRIGDLAPPSVLAVALAFAAGSLLNVILLALALRRAAKTRLGARLSFEGGAIVSMIGAAVLSGVAAYAALLPFPALIPTNTFAGIALQGLVAGAVGIAVYAFALAWQGNAEISGIAESVRRRLIRPAAAPEVFEVEQLDGETRR